MTSNSNGDLQGKSSSHGDLQNKSSSAARKQVLDDSNIRKLLIKLSLPAMVGMMIQALYNVVDRIYVGQGVGKEAIAGITICFPIQMMALAVGTTVGIGAASMISRSLGSGDIDRADRTFGNAVLLSVVFGSLIATFGLTNIDWLLNVFGSTPSIYQHARDYLGTILIGNVFFAYSVASNNIIRSEGNAKVAMISMLISALSNIILDPIFIFWFKMGVRGAAIATVMAQFLMAVWVTRYHLSGGSHLTFRFSYLKPVWNIIREMMAIGSSSFARQIAMSGSAILVNQSLRHYGSETHIAAFGIINSIIMMVMMPIFGISQALQPIIGFNYGAKRYFQIKRAYIMASGAGTVIIVIGTAIMALFPTLLIKAFTTDTELIHEAARYMRVIIFGLPFVALQINGTVNFQATGKASAAMLLSLSRQVLMLIPMVIVLPKFFGLFGVFVSFPISDILTTLLTLVFVIRQIRHFNKLSALETVNV